MTKRENSSENFSLEHIFLLFLKREPFWEQSLNPFFFFFTFSTGSNGRPWHQSRRTCAVHLGSAIKANDPERVCREALDHCWHKWPSISGECGQIIALWVVVHLFFISKSFVERGVCSNMIFSPQPHTQHPPLTVWSRVFWLIVPPSTVWTP